MDITFFGISINEPSTMLTDWLISVACLLFFLKLRHTGVQIKEVRYLRFFLFFLACSTFLGGLFGHGLQGTLSFVWKTPGWIIGMFAIAFFEWMALERMHQSGISGPWKTFSLLVPWKLTIFIALALLMLSFHVVEAQSVSGVFLLTLPLEIWLWRKTRNEASRWIIAGILFSTLSALVHSLRVSLHEWFNHMDLAHLVIVVATWCYYRAGKAMLGQNQTEAIRI